MSNSGIYFRDGWHIRISFKLNCFILFCTLPLIAWPSQNFLILRVIIFVQLWSFIWNYQIPPHPHFEELPGKRKAMIKQREPFLQRIDSANLPCLGVGFIPSIFILTFDKSHLCYPWLLPDGMKGRGDWTIKIPLASWPWLADPVGK